ncbi:MAG: hypothetical protein AMXMBFR48_19460 [Ignavibacteriales bacterium]
MKNNLLAISFLTLLFVAALKPQDWKVKISEVDTAQFPRLTVRLNLFDNKAFFIKDLQKRDIRLFEDKKPVSEFSLDIRKNQKPLKLVILLDVSGSMKGVKFDSLKIALNEFLSVLDGQDECAMVTFSDNVSVLSNFTTEYFTLSPLITNIKLGPLTRMNDGIIESAKLFSAFENSRNAILLITDGKDEGSVFNLQSAIERVQSKKIEVLSIALGVDADLYSLSSITKETGGSYSGRIDPQELRFVIGNIYENLKKNYEISFRTPDSLNTTEGSKRKIGVQISYLGESGNDEAEYILPKRQIKAITHLIVYIAIGLGVLSLLLILIYFLQRKKQQDQMYLGLSSTDHITGLDSGGGTDDADSDDDETGWEEEFNRQIKEKKTVVVNKGKYQTVNLLGYLIMRSRKYGMQVYELKQREVVIGRADSCDIVIDDDEVSKQNTKVRIVGNQYFVDDMGSANGTLINDTQTYHSELKDGDVIKINDHEFVFKCIS